MKTIGIVGGIGPDSTIEYYRLLIASGHTAIIINSVDVGLLLGWMGRNDLPAVADYLSSAVATLEAAGAEVGLIAANTPHIVFDEVQRRSSIPMVSIVEATRAHVQALGLHTVAILGTRYTMQGRFYPDELSKHGITLVVPAEDEQTYIHDKYLNELLKGIFLPATRDGLLNIVDAMAARSGIEAVILGGTELPLILRDPVHANIPLLDTTTIHVRAAIAKAA